MKNPTKQKNYTTIFADGQVILENPWIIDSNGRGKWYWDGTAHGGIVAWNEIPEGGYKPQRFYKLPEWELRDLIKQAFCYESLLRYNEVNIECIKTYLQELGYNSLNDVATHELNAYYYGYKIIE